MDFEFTAEQRQIKLLTQKFVREVLRPQEQVLEEHEDLPDSLHVTLVSAAKQVGLWSAFVPERLGGGGIEDLVTQTLVREELGATSYGLRHYVDNAVGGQYANATQFQLDKYFLPLLQGEVRSFTAATEPNAGSDNGAMETSAWKDGDDWVINGSKHFISGADHAAFGVVYAVTDKARGKHGGISGFLVDRNTPGFTIGRRQTMMGHRGFNQHVLHFDDCRVPDANLLGVHGAGLPQFLRGVTTTRIKIGIEAVGAAQYALDMAVAYAKVRTVLGSALAEKQGIQWMLADSAVELQAARLLCYYAAAKADSGSDVRVEASMAKLFGTETASRVIDRALQVHGGLGYCEELPLARLFRDARGARIYEGPTEVQRYIISRSMLA